MPGRVRPGTAIRAGLFLSPASEFGAFPDRHGDGFRPPRRKPCSPSSVHLRDGKTR
jgi:hypothetical protein